MARATGLRFAAGTSVGAGQALEFYVNFGWAGVVIGFVLLGLVLGALDAGLGTGLSQGDGRRVLTAALPGLALLQLAGTCRKCSQARPLLGWWRG